MHTVFSIFDDLGQMPKETPAAVKSRSAELSSISTDKDHQPRHRSQGIRIG